MLFMPTDSKRHFKHGKDSQPLLKGPVRRGQAGDHVAAGGGAARLAPGAPQALQKQMSPCAPGALPSVLPSSPAVCQISAPALQNSTLGCGGVSNSSNFRAPKYSQAYEVGKPFPCCFVRLCTAKHKRGLGFSCSEL